MSMQGAKWFQWDAVSGPGTAGPRRCTSVCASVSGAAVVQMKCWDSEHRVRGDAVVQHVANAEES